MVNGINARTVLSTLPVVGPVVGAYNVLSSKVGAAFSNSMLAVSEAGASEAYAQGDDAAYGHYADQFENQRGEELQSLRKERMYSKAAFVGHLVNLIGLITLLAVGVFTGPLAVILTTILAVGAIFYAYNAYRADQILSQQALNQ